jgi:hypothetical protein
VRADDRVYNTTHQNQNQNLDVQKTKISKLNQIKTTQINLSRKTKPKPQISQIKKYIYIKKNNK